MACKLRPSPTGIHIFLVVVGATVGVYIESESALAKLTAATLDNNPLTVTNDKAVSFTVPVGVHILLLSVQSPDAKDTIRMFEDGGAGQNQKLDEYSYDPNDPARAYRIAA
jgi:hypothetical protein